MMLCNNPISYLDQIIASPLPDEYERYNADLARDAEVRHQSGLEMFKALITAGQNAINTSMLLNGGAAVAMLAFIGHLASTKPGKVVFLAPTIVPFALGALSFVAFLWGLLQTYCVLGSAL